MTELILYDAACRAIAEAVAVDELMDIRDQWRVRAAASRIIGNRQMEADAVTLRMRAERRLGQIMAAQRDAGLLKRGGDRRSKDAENPLIKPPTLAELGVTKALATQVNKLASMDDARFADVLATAQSTAGKVSMKTVFQATKKEDRHENQQALGAKIKALPDERFGILYADPATKFEVHSERGLDRSADNHYPTQTLDEIKAMPIDRIAASDCLLLMWTTVPMLAHSIDIIRCWGFEYKSMLTWDKVVPGTGYWFRNQTEHLIAATRGNFVAPGESQRPSSLWEERKAHHSKKPDGIADWIRSTWPDVPKIELFARQARDGWDRWGNEAEEEAA